jgi:glycosyltransferase involved in cell wall biosynthesis
MPSPISHTAVGYVIYKIFKKPGVDTRQNPAIHAHLFLIITALSMLPDLDAIPGILVGNLRRFHNNESHSFFVGIGIALLGALLIKWRTGEKFKYWFLLIFSAYGFHIVMDYFTYGRGVMAFWPLSSERYLSPVVLFYGLRWSEGIFSIKHLWTVLSEGLFVLFIFLAVRGVENFHPKRAKESALQMNSGHEKKSIRIGIMLRTLDEKGGIGVYTRNLVDELLAIDRENEYVLFYRSPEHQGNFEHKPNVSERVIRGANKLVWDQVRIPLACRREKVDVLFHPKFTVPLLAPCKTIMVVHGADWFFPEQAQYYPWWDVLYNRIAMPLYFRKAQRVISVSQLTTDGFNRALRLKPGKIQTVYMGVGRRFKPILDPKRLMEAKKRYALPDNFILTLTKLRGDARKNLKQIIKAYEIYHNQSAHPHKLVIGGKDCEQFRALYKIPDSGYGKDISFPGWIHQEDLPAIYSQASLYLYPSNLEAFPIPVVEAMSCGTPLITSNVNGLKEIAADGALYVDPQNPHQIAEGIQTILVDIDLRNSLIERGLARSKIFSWEKGALETLAILKDVGLNEEKS